MAHLKVTLITVLAAVVRCEPPLKGYHNQPARNNFNIHSYNAPSNSYLPPSTGPNTPSNSYLPSTFGPSSEHHSYKNGHRGHENENDVPKSYEFGYSVKDSQSGNDYDRRESSDGNVVRGEYRVQLPDGRTQIVTYHADWQTGFHADVRYEGEAKYPEPIHNTRPQGGYNYIPPSDFRGSLTGFHGNRNTGYTGATTKQYRQ